MTSDLTSINQSINQSIMNCRHRCSSSVTKAERPHATAVQGLPLLSVRPAVTFPVSRVVDLGRYQFIVLGEQRHLCVNDLPVGSFRDNGRACD